MWVNLTPEEAAAAAELDALPDRAAAIVGATILEAKLGNRLKRDLPNFVIKGNNTLHDRIFNFQGPLGPFSARIDAGFILKIYDEATWRDLDIIRRIRNDFAHTTVIGSFTNDSIRERCGNLKVCDNDRAFSEYSSENHALASAAETLDSSGKLDFMLHVPDLEARRADPKQRYLLCIKYYSAILDYTRGLKSFHP
jgi:hypothetical protein